MDVCLCVSSPSLPKGGVSSVLLPVSGIWRVAAALGVSYLMVYIYGVSVVFQLLCIPLVLSIDKIGQNRHTTDAFLWDRQCPSPPFTNGDNTHTHTHVFADLCDLCFVCVCVGGWVCDRNLSKCTCSLLYPVLCVCGFCCVYGGEKIPTHTHTLCISL